MLFKYTLCITSPQFTIKNQAPIVKLQITFKLQMTSQLSHVNTKKCIAMQKIKFLSLNWLYTSVFY